VEGRKRIEKKGGDTSREEGYKLALNQKKISLHVEKKK